VVRKKTRIKSPKYYPTAIHTNKKEKATNSVQHNIIEYYFGLESCDVTQGLLIYMGLQVPQKKLFPAHHLLPTDDVAVSSWNLQFACSLCSYRVHYEDETSNNVEVLHHQKKLVIVVVVVV
jgi:hypothetical protein